MSAASSRNTRAPGYRYAHIGSRRAYPRVAQFMKNTALRRAAALPLALTLVTAGCFLPPPAEDRPLTGALSELPRGQSPSGSPRDAGAENGAPERLSVSDPDSVDQAAQAAERRGGSSGAGPETAVLEVQSAAREELEQLGGVDETVAAISKESPAPEADESAVDGGQANGAGSGELAEASAPAALEDEAEAPVTLVPLEVETTDGLVMSCLYKAADDPVANAPAVVFIHGWCGRSDQWSYAMGKLSAGRSVYAVDLIGHGRSKGQVRAEWTISRFGADIVKLLEDQQLESVVLVGHGMGGQVALSAAARAPSRVAGILGVDCLHRLAGEPRLDQVEPYVQAFTLAYGEQMRAFVDSAVHGSTAAKVKERIIEDALSADKAAALALMEHFGVHDPRREAPKIECGVVCLNSEGLPESLPTDVAGNRALLSSFDLRTIPNTGHWIHLESPIAFVQETTAYLDGLAFRSEPVSILETLNPVLVVKDVTTAAAFYTAKLGFQVIRRRPQDTDEPPVVVTLERDGARVVIQSLASLQGELPGAKIQSGGGVLFLRVGGIDVELRKLGQGVTVVSPKRTLASGAKQAVIADPEGNVVVLQENPARGTDG